MNDIIIRDRIEEAIQSVVTKFRQHPNTLLTEDDLRFHLCSELLHHFGEIEQTQDGDHSISLHTEVRWYGNENLRIRSDIVLIDVSNLNVLNYGSLPSKGYGFNIPKAIIELKFRRPNGCSDNRFIDSIKTDITKLTKLTQVFLNAIGTNRTQFWMIAFDKKNNILSPNHSVEVPNDIEYIYEFSNRSEQSHGQVF